MFTLAAADPTCPSVHAADDGGLPFEFVLESQLFDDRLAKALKEESRAQAARRGRAFNDLHVVAIACEKQGSCGPAIPQPTTPILTARKTC